MLCSNYIILTFLSTIFIRQISTFYVKEGWLIANIDNSLFIQAVAAILKRNKMTKTKPCTYRQLANLTGINYNSLKDFMYDGRGGENINKKIATVLHIER